MAIQPDVYPGRKTIKNPGQAPGPKTTHDPAQAPGQKAIQNPGPGHLLRLLPPGTVTAYKYLTYRLHTPCLIYLGLLTAIPLEVLLCATLCPYAT